MAGFVLQILLLGGEGASRGGFLGGFIRQDSYDPNDPTYVIDETLCGRMTQDKCDRKSSKCVWLTKEYKCVDKDGFEHRQYKARDESVHFHTWDTGLRSNYMGTSGTTSSGGHSYETPYHAQPSSSSSNHCDGRGETQCGYTIGCVWKFNRCQARSQPL